MTIAAVILTHNSQASIKNLIRSLSWCDEIIVIDDESTDRTRTLAQTLKAKVFIRPLRHNFAAQRNFGLKQVTTDWAVFVDADEIIPPGLATEIKSVLNSDSNGFFVRRLDYFLGRQLQFGETGHLHLLRLARRTAGRWHRPVHETWQVQPPIGQLQSPLYHHPHRSLSDFLAKINHYTDIEAKYRSVPGAAQLLFELLFYPSAKFILNFILKLGFLDGFPGLIMALMMSFHSLLVRLKLYEKTLAGPARHSSPR